VVAAAPAPQALNAAPAAPVPALAGAVVGGVSPEIDAFLNQWISDWQARNPAAFFAHYVPEFRGSSASRAEWETGMLPRIQGPRRLTVSIQDLRSRVVSPVEARIVFREVFVSDIGNEVMLKAMFLTRRDGRWMVQREFATLDQR
jgi:hypothetical protein